MEIKDHEKRLTQLEDLDLKAILEKIQTNIERIMKKMDENHRQYRYIKKIKRYKLSKPFNYSTKGNEMAKNNSRDNYNRILSINGVQYKLNRIIDKTETDIHHLIGKKYRMKYNTNEEENKVRISRREHIALNNYF